MKKRILSIFLIVCLCAALLPSFAAADTSTIQGTGVEDDPWILTQEYFGTAGHIVNQDLKNGYYRLGAYITIDFAVQNRDHDADITLDLYGHKLK